MKIGLQNKTSFEALTPLKEAALFQNDTLLLLRFAGCSNRYSSFAAISGMAASGWVLAIVAILLSIRKAASPASSLTK